MAVVKPGGLRVKRRGPDPVVSSEPIGGTRGEIRGMSRKSQKRMLVMLQSVPWAEADAFFVTLTWHEGFTSDAEQWHAALRLWRQRLQRHYGAHVGGVWKLELQERKSGEHEGDIAPHFHLVVFWQRGRRPSIASFRRWVSRSWNEVVEPGDAAHLAAGTNVRPVRNVAGPEMGRLLSYLSKYMGKLEAFRVVDKETGEIMKTGRSWGTWGEIPQVTGRAVSMTREEFEELTRRINAWADETGSWYHGAISPEWAGFTLWGDGELLEARLLEGLGEPVLMPGEPWGAAEGSAGA